MLSDAMVADYLRRIGATRPPRADLDGLRHLQERHVLSVPFENLDYHLDQEIHLDEKVVEKIVHNRRGGGCYELNPSLGYLLRALGYQVTVHPGQVYRAGVLGPPMMHLVLKVVLDDESWLVDAGFRRNSRRPLLLSSRAPQADPHGEFRLADTDGHGIDVLLDGQPLYRFDDRPVRLEDFLPTLWWWRTAPESPFLRDLFCSLPTETGRVTLKGRKLTRSDGDQRYAEELADDAAVLAAYKDHFGFSLDTLPTEPAHAGAKGIQLD
jgi:N-hydroxyarylamine O-acetyltransferase